MLKKKRALLVAALVFVGCVPSAHSPDAEGLSGGTPDSPVEALSREDGGGCLQMLRFRLFEGQKRPPCDWHIEVARAGGCWIEAEGSPPCPEDWFESGGRCYQPVRARREVPG